VRGAKSAVCAGPPHSTTLGRMNPTPSIQVTFKENFPLHLIREFAQHGFLNLCRAVSAATDPRVLVLHPTPHEYHVLKLQLKELEGEGALTFEDGPSHAP